MSSSTPPDHYPVPGPPHRSRADPSEPDRAAGRLAQLGWDAGWDAAARTADTTAGPPTDVGRVADPAGPSVVLPAPGCPAPAPPAPAALSPGRVVRADRGRAMVHTGSALVHAAVTDPDITTGDWVLLDRGAVRTVLPRRTAVVRGAGRRDARAQVLAANVDVVMLVVALTTGPNLARLDRLLTVAWGSGARPVVVLSKADRSATAQSERDEVADAAPGVPVLLTSVLDGRGLDELRGRLAPGRTVALLGTSGAGKSSLVNALAGTGLMPVGRLHEDGRGRHTTVARELVVLPGLGVLVDTPGLRGVQLWESGTATGLERTFADVEALATQCRYSDCQHGTEPGCAVTAAVAEGRLSARRLDSYTRLRRETAWLQARYDARLRAEQRRAWRTLAKSVRQRGHR